MARRSGRKIKAPEIFDPVLPIRDSPDQTSKTSKRPKRNLLTLSNALQTNSPVLKQDIQSLFANTVRDWSSLSESKKRSLLDAFPSRYRTYDTDEDGKLKCPISEDFTATDSIIKRDVARFKRDVKAGFYLKKWQEEGKRAMRDRAEGHFDYYIKHHAEDFFGEIQNVQNDQEMADATDQTKEKEESEEKGGR
jgi:Asx homology domain